MIRQVTAGFLVAAAKTHFQAGSGEEAGEGRETRDTVDREGSKQACPLLLEEQGRAAGSSACFHVTPSPGKGTASASLHAAPQTRTVSYPLCLGQGTAIQGCPHPTSRHLHLQQPL